MRSSLSSIWVVVFSVLAFFMAGEVLCVRAQDPGNVEIIRLTSRIFQNTRSIRVLLPPDYNKAGNHKKRYAVIYFNDGVTVFSSKPTGVNIEQVASRLYAEHRLPPLIVVGIDNGASTDKNIPGVDGRAMEFLPYPDVGFAGMKYEPDPPDPHGKLYPEFLINEVMPMINSHYRIKAGSANTGLAGFSYGGVAALFTAMKYPSVFGKLIVDSTPLWIGRDYQLIKDVTNTTKWPRTVCFGGSIKETDNELINAEGGKDQKKVLELIRRNSPRTKLNLILVDGAAHGGAAWRGRIEAELRFLFP